MEKEKDLSSSELRQMYGTNDEIFGWLQNFRATNPKRFYLARLRECGERLEKRFNKHGKDEEFFAIQNELNKKIKNFSNYVSIIELVEHFKNHKIKFNY